MRYGRYGLAYLCLRIGLGIVFVWIGIDILRHPDRWIGYLPEQIPFGFSRELALQSTGALDLALGTAFLIQLWPKLVAALAVIHFIGIFVIHGVDEVLIRDLGLLGTALALLVWPARVHHRKGFRFRIWPARGDA